MKGSRLQCLKLQVGYALERGTCNLKHVIFEERMG